MEKGWKAYIKLMAVFGVLEISDFHKLYFLTFMIFQIAIFFIALFNNNWMSAIKMYGNIGKTTEYFQYVLNCLKNEIIFIWTFWFSSEYKFILKTIFEIEKLVAKFATFKNNITLKYFKILIFLNLAFISSLNISKYNYFPNLKIMFTNSYGLAMLTYEIDFIRTSLLFMFYNILISKILEMLQKINLRLEWISLILEINETNYISEVEFLLILFDRLINKCIFKLNNLFGFCVIITFPYIIFESVQAFFFLTFDVTINDIFFDIVDKTIVIIWICCKIFIFGMILKSDSIWKEVS